MDLKDLIKRLSEDPDFEAKFNDLDSVEAVVECATKEGYTITDKDIEALRRELEYISSGCIELRDDELDDVAGGVSILAMPMGSGMGPQPSWVTNLVTVFAGKSKSTGSSGGTINAQKLPAEIRDMATTALPHKSNEMPGISKLPFGATIPLDHTETSI